MTVSLPARQRPALNSGLPLPTILPGSSGLFLSESVDVMGEGAYFLESLAPEDREKLQAHGRYLSFSEGDEIFAQGDQHSGIFIIEAGTVRVFYTAPSGREITFAYWTRGSFIGGPEMTGGGVHIWSGEAMSDCRILFLPTSTLKRLITELPNFALCLLQGLAAKGRCYSAMLQMLGTRSVIERLAQLLINLGEIHGVRDGKAIVINFEITHNQIATMVGSTRQWVTMMMTRFQKDGLITAIHRHIRIERPDGLMEMISRRV